MKDVKTFFNKINSYSRTDLTERPTEWPDRAERIETTAKELAQALQVFNKRLSACMQSDSHYDNIKRVRKMKESKYAEAMAVAASQFTCSYMLSHVFRSLAELGQDMAEERFNYELMVDQILAYFREVELTTLPTLAKQRKHLARACAELRQAKEKQRHVESLRPEPAKQTEWTTKKDECARRVADQEKRVAELEKATLSQLYGFDGECQTYSSNLLELLKHLENYHRKCLMLLSAKIPLIEKDLSDRSFSPVFECSLMQHLEESRREIAFPIELCVQALNTEDALREEGLFRIAGTKNKVELLRRSLNSMAPDAVEIVHTCDAHTVADTLKQYLRGLPEPLLKSALFEDWAASVKIADRDARRNALQSCVLKLPQDHYINLKFFIAYLHRVSQYSSENKMTSRNLGIVLGPSLLWRRRVLTMEEMLDNDQATEGEISAAVPNEVVASLIEYAPCFFPDGELMIAVASGLRASGGRRSSLSTPRRTSVPDSPIFPAARPLSISGMRRWPAAGSSSALFSSTRRPGTLGAPGQRWGASSNYDQHSRFEQFQQQQQQRRYASMSSIETRSSVGQVGESVVLDISHPKDFPSRRAPMRSRTPQPQAHHDFSVLQTEQHGKESSLGRRTDTWRTSDSTTSHVSSVDKRRYSSQQQLSSSGDSGIRVAAVPVSNADRVEDGLLETTTRRDMYTRVRRAGSVDAMGKGTERTVLEVQVNGNRNKMNGALRGVPVEVKITPDKGPTKL